jgi:hypothetical protein
MSQRYQPRPEQIALAKRHAPVAIAPAVARLGAGAVPAGTVVLVIVVLDLNAFQRVLFGRGRGLAQVDHQVGVHGARGTRRGQRAAAACAVRGVMR